MAATRAAARSRARRELIEEARLWNVKERCWDDPKALINEIKFFDPSTEKWVEFSMYPPEDWEPPTSTRMTGEWVFSEAGAEDWFWQSLLIDWWQDPNLKKYLILKARQLGITLLACARALWLMLYRPGSTVVAYSYTEDEAVKLVVASWQMFEALPPILKNHVEVVVPKRSVEPTEWIKLRHADGRISSFQALPATKKHGHGGRVTFAIMDEVARQDYAREIYTAINPATTRGKAKLVMISTANGVSNKETGEGNFFHRLWATKDEKRLAYRFLPWNLEPSRDDEWYEEEAMKLDDVERNQQYPLNELDAFMLSGDLYFDRDSLAFYRGSQMSPLFSGDFVMAGARLAKFKRRQEGVVQVYELPRPDGSYAIGVDTATGRGSDYTSGDVIDLSSGAIVAHYHAKVEQPRAAIQLFFLGRWFSGRDNEALICVERQGGYGEALIVALRDGTRGLPPYRRLYRHKTFTRATKMGSEDYGHPMGKESRNRVLDNLKAWVRERRFPWITAGHMDELGTFVYWETGPSPRAQEGCNDDRVMSLALATEMFRQHGDFASLPQRRKRRKPQTTATH